VETLGVSGICKVHGVTERSLMRHWRCCANGPRRSPFIPLFYFLFLDHFPLFFFSFSMSFDAVVDDGERPRYNHVTLPPNKQVVTKQGMS
jgi:hypothetical protein